MFGFSKKKKEIEQQEVVLSKHDLNEIVSLLYTVLQQREQMFSMVQWIENDVLGDTYADTVSTYNRTNDYFGALPEYYTDDLPLEINLSEKDIYVIYSIFATFDYFKKLGTGAEETIYTSLTNQFKDVIANIKS